MQECWKIFKWLGILIVLCVMSSTMAFSADKTKAMDNQTNITNMTLVNASENMTLVNASENMTLVNASENISSSSDTLENVSVVSGASINILTGTSSVSWEEAVQNIVSAVNAMGQQVKSIQVLKFDVKLENGKITVYEATVLLTN
jgi:flavin-binding protein dodecin